MTVGVNESPGADPLTTFYDMQFFHLFLCFQIFKAFFYSVNVSERCSLLLSSLDLHTTASNCVLLMTLNCFYISCPTLHEVSTSFSMINKVATNLSTLLNLCSESDNNERK